MPLELFQELITAAELVDALGGDVSNRPSFEVDDNLGAFFLALDPEFHGQPAEMCWIQAGGPQLLLTAMDDDQNLRLLITTATNLNVVAGEELAFSRSIGSLQFCEINSNSIQRMLVSDRMGFSTVLREAAAGSIESAIEMGFAANLHLYCPAVVATLEMREVVLAHRLLRHFSIEADAESSAIAPLARRETVFNDSIRPLLDARDNVRMGVARVTFLEFNILHSFDQIKLRLFLKFVTASPVLPISGLQGLGHPISISRSRPDPTKTLPTASTCFSDLRLPEYASEDFLRSNLTLAIHASAAMGLA